MAKIKAFYKSLTSPTLFGLVFLVLLFSGCRTASTPEQVTIAFWQAIIDNDLHTARQYSNQNSQQLLNQQPHPEFKGASITTGQIIINKVDASVETRIQVNLEENQVVAFKTLLIKEQDSWKVDYPRTLQQLSGNVFNHFFKSLEKFGKSLNQQLEEQLPLIEKEVESFGEQLEQQLEQFSRELDKATQPKTAPPDSI